MKRLIRKLLREAIENKINEWENNIGDFGKVLGTPIWIDYDTGDMFYLFVGFTTYGSVEAFSYSFMLIDKDHKPKTEYLVRRTDVEQYIPDEIKNKRQIFPIVEELTKKILDKMIPEEIYRQTVEPLTSNSLERYERITQIMINDYGYSLKENYIDNNGCTIWRLTKTKETINNKNLDETYDIGGIPSGKQILKDTFDWVLPKLPKVILKK